MTISQLTHENLLEGDRVKWSVRGTNHNTVSLSKVALLTSRDVFLVELDGAPRRYTVRVSREDLVVHEHTPYGR